eukprot:2169787-Pyramimonas_sp.AAC.1
MFNKRIRCLMRVNVLYVCSWGIVVVSTLTHVGRGRRAPIEPPAARNLPRVKRLASKDWGGIETATFGTNPRQRPAHRESGKQSNKQKLEF